MKRFTRFTAVINGRSVEAMVDERASLADVLRGEFRLLGVKKGCEVGECGACTVLIDGESFNSCIYLAAWANGKTITTVEGLAAPDGTLSVVQQAFVDEGAIQCGFCTPGFLLSVTEMEREHRETGRSFTDDEIRKRLSGHLCRCTGYENILRAARKVCA